MKLLLSVRTWLLGRVAAKAMPIGNAIHQTAAAGANALTLVGGHSVPLAGEALSFGDHPERSHVADQATNLSRAAGVSMNNRGLQLLGTGSKRTTRPGPPRCSIAR